MIKRPRRHLFILNDVSLYVLLSESSTDKLGEKLDDIMRVYPRLLPIPLVAITISVELSNALYNMRFPSLSLPPEE